MSIDIAHGGMFMAGNTLLVFLPFIVAGAGLAFIMRAFTDKIDRRPDDDGPARLPTREAAPVPRPHADTVGREAVQRVTGHGPDGGQAPVTAVSLTRGAGAMAGLLFAAFIGLATIACIAIVIWGSEEPN